jgi:hypothetical protein
VVVVQIKADVETQGEFVESLAAEVRAAAYTDIEDVVDFVNWLDEELSFLVLFIFTLFKNLIMERLFGATLSHRDSLDIVACCSFYICQMS